MDAGRAESRFLLPGTIDAAMVLGPEEEWREELRKFGIADIAIGSPDALDQALAGRPESLLVEGSVRPRVLERAGYAVRRYAALPARWRPHAIVPLGEAGPAGHVLRTWLAPGRRWQRERNRLLASAIAHGIAAPRQALTVASREPPVPRLISATAELGLPPDPSWVLAPAQGDRLSRGVFLVYPNGEGEPSHAVKFARMPGWAEPFERDEAALRLLDGAGEDVTRRVPRLLGRLNVDGLETSVETAAPGQRLIGFLHSAAAGRDKRAAIEQIAGWVLELGSSTQASSAELEPERERLARELLADRHELPDRERVLAKLDGVAAVLQHNDLGTWNVAIGAGAFTVLDWESARRYGMPLWDLWYFLMDAEAHLAGAATLEQREEHFAGLFGGRLPASAGLFRWTERCAKAVGVPRAALGPLATMCWLHHGRSGAVRTAELGRFQEDVEPVFGLQLLERIGERWLTDPALGPEWPALTSQ